MLAESLTGVAAAAFAYHHAIYPALLARIADPQRGRAGAYAPSTGATLPTVTLIVPAHNEAAMIEAKLRNIAAIDYPVARLSVVVACDGCTDSTLEIARRTAHEFKERLTIEIVDYPYNIGKVAVLNEQIARASSDIVALTDASATFDAGALLQAIAHFDDPGVGVVCPTYRLARAGSAGEAAYWDYQTRLKTGESKLSAPMGAHGAFYLFRRRLWSHLPADTINDDFVLPMRIVAAGARAVYDPSIVAVEQETTNPVQEFNRRVRIGAGNMQQLIRMWTLADPRQPRLAFTFLSGKGLRPLIPLLAFAALIAMAFEAAMGKAAFQIGTLLAIGGLSLAAFAIANKGRVTGTLAWLGYLVEGHAASALGALRFLAIPKRKPWGRADTRDTIGNEVYVPFAVSVSKRVIDIVCALGALAVLIVAFVPIALAIKLTSRGPVFYRQLRVGCATPEATHLFYLIKFRTMRIDAEAATGAVWASKNDPRVTAVGRFMRKTRLDELPQAINVLKGEMSVIGPRPERPSFFSKLEDAIPFYVERTYGLRPGITGLAQVNQPYDQCIEDVRNKVLYDHAYAAHLVRWRDWLRTDLSIILKTAVVMGLGKGQ